MNTFKSVNPYSLEEIGSHDIMNGETIREILESSSATFNHWRKTSLDERGVRIKKIAALLRERRDEYASV